MKKGKYRYLATRIPLYGCLLHVLVGHDLEAMCQAAGIADNGINGNPLSNFNAFTFVGETTGEPGYFALFRPDASANTVAHEAVHIVNKIFNDRGIRLDSLNDEPQAYLTGWVAEKFNYALTSKELKPSRKVKLC